MDDKLTPKEILWVVVVPFLVGAILIGLFLGIIALFAANGMLATLVGIILFLMAAWFTGMLILWWVDENTDWLDKLFRNEEK